ncbi:MAG: hypothetical protein MK135_02430 [Polyangiaceae bacterium]|nr:hypothetical protein [Polyangiaceae bacterium]
MTERFILIGHPVAQSVSPPIHQKAYSAFNRKAEYHLVDAPTEDDVAECVDQIRLGQISGANITVPWKKLALRLADRVADSAQKVGAANVLARNAQGEVVAHNTDAIALAEELKLAYSALLASQGKAANTPPGSAMILGAGGAALAAVVSARQAGATHVYVSARRFTKGSEPESWPGADELLAIGAELIPWPSDTGVQEVFFAALQNCTWLIQATSAGMKGKASGEGLAQMLHLSQVKPLVAYDLIYNPTMTPFLIEAERFGHIARGGLGMLVGQAAHAIDIWWGILPEQQPLLQAAREAMGLSPVVEGT